MSVREYIGARYVPLFIGDWDNTVTYEPLSIVQYQGNSYTSRQYVPTGIEITNEIYWAVTGNYNAQVEAYRNEVMTFDNRIDNLETAVGDENSGLIHQVEVNENDIDNLKTAVGDENSGLIHQVEVNENDIDALELALSTIQIDTNDIVDGAVTEDKISNGAVTEDKISESTYDYIKTFNKAYDILTNVDAFIDVINGNDETAELGNRDKPFRTLDAAANKIDAISNNFRMSFLSSGTYTWTARVFSGSVIHLFVDDEAQGEVTVFFDTEYDAQTSHGLFFYDTHMNLKGLANKRLTIRSNADYMELEGSNLWTSGNVLLDFDRVYCISGGSHIFDTEISGQLEMYCCNAYIQNIVIKNQNNALDGILFRVGCLRLTGNNLIQPLNSADSEKFAFNFQSALVHCNQNMNTTNGNNSNYARFIAAYQSVLFMSDANKTKYDALGNDDVLISTSLRVKSSDAEI